MPDDELKFLAASGKVRERRLQVLRLVIQERERMEADADKAEELDIAREANRLAEAANDKANTANTIATIATIIAIVAIAISIVSAIVQSAK